MTCKEYSPWSKQDPPLNMNECFHVIPWNDRYECSCQDVDNYGEKCVFEFGVPDDKKTMP